MRRRKQKTKKQKTVKTKNVKTEKQKTKNEQEQKTNKSSTRPIQPALSSCALFSVPRVGSLLWAVATHHGVMPLSTTRCRLVATLRHVVAALANNKQRQPNDQCACAL